MSLFQHRSNYPRLGAGAEQKYSTKWDTNHGYYGPLDEVETPEVITKASNKRGAVTKTYDPHEYIKKCAADGIHPLAPFYKPATSSVSMGEINFIPQSTLWILPDPLTGPNPKIAEGIHHLVAMLDALGILSKIVPTYPMPPDATEIIWTETQFRGKPRLAPPLSLPSLVSAWVTGGRAGIQRVYFGGEIGLDWLSKKAGQAHWFETMIQMALGFASDLALERMIMLSTAAENFREQGYATGDLDRPTIHELVETKVKNWAMLQRPYINTVQWMHSYVLRQFQLQRGDITAGLAYMWSWRLATLITKKIERRSLYNTTGLRNIALMLGDIADTMTIDGLKIYIAEEARINDHTLQDTLSRNTEIGGQVDMFPEDDDGTNGPYKSKDCAVQVVTMPTGKKETITLQTALNECLLFNPDGSIACVDGENADFTLDALKKDFVTRHDDDDLNPIEYIGEISKDDLSLDYRCMIGRSLLTSMPHKIPLTDFASAIDDVAKFFMISNTLPSIKDGWGKLNAAVEAFKTEAKLQLLETTFGEIGIGLDSYEGLLAAETFQKYVRTNTLTDQTPAAINNNKEVLQGVANFMRIFRYIISQLDKATFKQCLLSIKEYWDVGNLPVNRAHHRDSNSLLFDTLLYNKGVRIGYVDAAGTTRATPIRFPYELARDLYKKTLAPEGGADPLTYDSKTTNYGPIHPDACDPNQPCNVRFLTKNEFVNNFDEFFFDFRGNFGYKYKYTAISVARPDLKPFLEVAHDDMQGHTKPIEEKMLAMMIDYTRAERDVFMAMANHHVMLPFKIIVGWPHQRWMTDGVRAFQEGNFGGLALQPGIVTVSQDGLHQTKTLSADLRRGSFVHKGRNITDVQDVGVFEYRAGDDTEPIKPHTAIYNPAEDKYNGSLVYIPVPANYDKIPLDFNILGDMKPLETEYSVTQQDKVLCYPTAPRMNGIFRWRINQLGSRMKYATGWIRYPNPTNIILRPMTHWKWRNGKWTKIAGNHYWKDDATFTNCGPMRTGGVFKHVPEVEIEQSGAI
jgi:hypothetical protein